MQKNELSFLPLTEATFLILVSLASPKHGYAIMQDVSAWSGSRARLGPGTLYGALTKLLEQGLIRRLEGDDGDERRKAYGLTALGRRVVERECDRLQAIAQHGRERLNGKGGRR